MTRLHRPYIPLEVRLIVASRQLSLVDIRAASMLKMMIESPLKKKLGFALGILFKGRKHELHHRPALENRPQFRRGLGKKTYYVPDANDPDHLVYLEKHDHHIETHVRGIGAQRSDTGQRNHQKAIDRNRGLLKRKRKVKIKSRGFDKRHRPFPKGRDFGRRA